MIQPLHEVRDKNKINKIADNMEINGWVGRPILVIDRGDHYQAITGSHRLAAAELAGVEPEIEIIDEGNYDDDIDDMEEISNLFCALIEGDDIDRLDALKTLAGKGLVDNKAVKIMEAEECD